MLIATFGQGTGWAGKTITREGDAFILEGHGPINAADVMEYDRLGHLTWAAEGTRGWVGSRVKASAPKPAVTLQSIAAAHLETARKQIAEGKLKPALRTLGYVLPDLGKDPALAKGMLELAETVRRVNDQQLKAECDRLIARAQATLSGTAVDPQAAGTPRTTSGIKTPGGVVSPLGIIGLLILVCGLIGVLYFMTGFDTSVEVPSTDVYGYSVGGERVNNIGLMRDQQNGIIAGVLAMVAGGVMLGIDFFRRGTGTRKAVPIAASERKCPYCAETIKAEAVVCRFCNRDVSQGAAG